MLVSTRHSMSDRTASVTAVDSKKINAARRGDSLGPACAFMDVHRLLGESSAASRRRLSCQSHFLKSGRLTRTLSCATAGRRIKADG